MKIQFMDLCSQYRKIAGEIHGAIDSVLSSANFVMGADVALFENEFAAYCRALHCVGVGNGTDALLLALKAVGVVPGDYVITVPNTFIATTEAITLAGGNIEFVDVQPVSLLMDPDKLEQKIVALRRQGVTVKAVVPVHLYGRPCDMDAITAITARYGVRVIEDAAQAHGAEINGRRVGTIADAACFSFYPGKNLGAYGDAGAVVTNDKYIADRVAMLRNHGRTKKYEHDLEGYNSRLDTIQAAILRVKLRHLEVWTDTRIANASLYSSLLSGNNTLTLPITGPGERNVYHLYVIRTARRDHLQQKLKEAGVATGIHYPIPLHLQPAYRHLGLATGAFPVVEQASAEILSLPMDAEISADAINYVCGVIHDSL